MYLVVASFLGMAGGGGKASLGSFMSRRGGSSGGLGWRGSVCSCMVLRGLW